MGALARGRVQEDSLRVEWAFSDRRGGSSHGSFSELNVGASVGDDPEAVAANRAEVASYVGGDQLALVRQVHGRDVAVLDDVPASPPDADAIVTRQPGLAIAVQVADCVPILMCDPRGGAVAAVHAGWRGLVADVVSATLEVMAPQGPVTAWVGPAICAGCYEVGPEVIDAVAHVAPSAVAVTRAGTPAVDVRAGVEAQLARHGVSTHLVGGCTFENPDLYSYRRDGVTGRQAGVIVMRDEAGRG